MLTQANVGINSADTFLTGNVGGGLKWYAPNGQWGLRGDYRFMATKSNDTAPAFFGQASCANVLDQITELPEMFEYFRFAHLRSMQFHPVICKSNGRA